MPTLRFSRDRRGYESTYLLHTSTKRSGPEQQRLLYWFRSPPHVKVGRAAFDEDTIRGLEEQHPDVEFDWDRILTTKPPPAPESRDPRDTRPARRPERRPAKDGRRDQPRAMTSGVVAAADPPLAGPETAEPDGSSAPGRPIERIESPASTVAPAGSPMLPVQPSAAAPSAPLAPARRFVRVFDLPADAAAWPAHHASQLSVVERVLGAEQLTVLRARYAEILARISARGGDPARIEALREQAAAIDPDAWVTESEVRAGLAALEPTLAELHRIVGRRRRRRRRDAGTPPVPGGASEGSALVADSGDAPEAGEQDDEVSEDGFSDE